MGINSSRHHQRQNPGGMAVQVSRDLIQCPVCLEIPEGDIYQCKNGHVMCDPCSQRTKLCPQPQCKESMEGKVRNRAMESFIADEGLVVDCKFKKHGCNKALRPRKELVAHEEDECDFGPIKRFNLCRRVICTACWFSSRRGDRVFHHFLEQHKFPMVVFPGLEGRLNSCLPTCLKDMRSTRFNLVSFAGLEVPISEGSGSLERFLICFHTRVVKKRDFSVICWYFGQEEDEASSMAGVAVTLELSVAEKNARWTWTGKPTHFSKIGFWNPYRSRPLKVPIPDLLEMVGGEDEKLNCSIQFSKKR